MAAENSPVATMTFEQALGELEGIVTKLEGGQTPLEDSINLYARGEELKKHCETLLKSAEARIEKITLSADGKAKGVEPLDVDK
ncbi:MAG: exodeoxyribonuclease small subunit [Hyphomicrobiales bacterium]|nr:exodeoxyribonuclease small subunit [Hyphomicrobiales bacterium]